jgi:nucleotide-binding universal stress UspA family protein
MSTFENNSPRIAYRNRRKPAIGHQRSTPKSDEAPFEIRITKILVPIDFSENSIRAARYAATIASQFGAEITLLHIIGAATFAKESSYLGFTEIGASGGAERRLSLLAKRNIPQGVTVKSVVETGIAFDTILEAARTMGSDLIIAAARCHPDAESPPAMPEGTVERVVLHAPCPVMVLQEFTEPGAP